jgi:hypothetical protein
MEAIRPGNFVPVRLVLHKSGESISGSIGPDAARQQPIEKPILRGDQLTFELYESQSMPKKIARFRLTITERRLIGDVTTSDHEVARIDLDRP